MSDTFTVSDAEGAAQLVAFGMRPRLHPSQDHEYEGLVRRYREDDGFQFLTDRIAFSLGLHMVKVSAATGAVLTALEGSAFETKIEDYARTSRHRGDGEKVMHGIIHLAVAALAFPRPADLADDGYIGRVKTGLVDETVREICRKLQRRAAQNESAEDAPSGTPELERAWRAYARRPETSETKDKRAASNSTRAMTSRALRFLMDQGLLTMVEDVDAEEAVYRTTPRYQVQVRELASTTAFRELLSLGVVPPITDPAGTLRVGLPGARASEPNDVPKAGTDV
ncbi:hypothetical protein KQY30_16695 [Streptomyces sp. GMY02]|uniref:hypothetical protein n=1 Tax=Streptomyces sp. GMY02 TaxID=1333528 RepID=UPI001C2C524A|nr:hypothetical protein [Streptomyces sp. GMY02]QXE35653.1 hypothetical protein KQY30_16695 [Streptomyces sp. GMY02]